MGEPMPGRLSHAIGVLVLIGVAASAVIGQTFPARQHPTDGSSDVASADFNADGHPDLVTCGAAVSILYGLGNGTFLPAQSQDVEDWAVALAVCDLDGDGWLDVVTCNNPSNVVSVLLGDGAGGLSTATSLPAASTPRGIAVEDLNGDGWLDVVTCGSGLWGTGGQLTILTGDGSGSLIPEASLTILDGARSVAAADLDGDGDADLVTAHSGTYGCDSGSAVALFLNDGAGSVAPAAMPPVDCNPQHVSIADVNGDDKLDIVAALRGYIWTGDPSDGVSNYSSLALLYGDGAGQFSPPTYLGNSGFTFEALPTDLDEDGWLDLVVVPSGAAVSTYQGVGGGAFEWPVKSYTVGNYTRGATVADFNHDGVKDIAAAIAVPDAITVLLGDGGGSFAGGKSKLSFEAQRGLAIHDLDGDGAPDVLALGSAEIAIALGLAGGGFAPGESYAPTSAGSGTAGCLGDVNGDSIPDTVAANPPDRIDVRLSDGLGGLWPWESSPLQLDAQIMALGDADGDTHTDLVLAAETSYGVGAVQALRGDGAGHFTLLATQETAFTPTGAAVGDVTGDGLADLLTCSSALAWGDPGTLWVSEGQGIGAFGPWTALESGAVPLNVQLLDLDEDGVTDILHVNYVGDSLTIRFGLTGGGVGEPVTYAVGASPWSFTVGDVNADGAQDVAVACTEKSNIAILLGTGSRDFARLDIVGAHGPLALGDLQGDGLLDLAISGWSAPNGVTLIPNSGQHAPFLPCGSGLAGSNGVPLLAGTGPLLPAEDVSLTLSSALAGSVAALVLGFSHAALPFQGGVLFPAPDVIVTGLSVDANGSLTLHGRWPAGLSPGAHLYFQCWIADPAAPQGLSASNGLVSTTP